MRLFFYPTIAFVLQALVIGDTMAKVMIVGSQIPAIAPLLAALGQDMVLSVSVPQGNKYQPHQGKKERGRRVKQLAKRQAK